MNKTVPEQYLLEKRKIQQEKFLEEVRRIGTISAGARAAEVSRRTAKRWIDTDPAYADLYEEALAEFKDSIEERLMDRIAKGNGATLRFKAKGELPEKYGDQGHRRPAQAAPDFEERWKAAEEAASRDEPRAG